METPTAPKPMPAPPRVAPPSMPTLGQPSGQVAGQPSGPVPARVTSAQPVDPSMLEGDEGEVPQEHPHHAGGFFNQPWVQNILPLATSLVLHVALITIGILLFKAVHEAVDMNKEQAVIPESKPIGKNDAPSGIPHPGLGGDPLRDAAQDVTHDTQPDSFNQDPSNKMANAMAGGNSDSASDGGAGRHSGSGKGNNAFGGGGGGGAAAFGIPGGGAGLGPKSNFGGTGGYANDIIYLCDASGSMSGVFASLRTQLKASINEMACDGDAQQRFNVIFFNEGKPSILFAGGMQFATAENKAAAMEFVDNAIAAGGTEPMPAIKEAIKEKPQLLYVLTDGFDNVSNFDEVVNAFKDGDKDGKMHINCIFLQSNEDPALVEVLKKIAKIGNGTMKITSKDEM